MASTTKHAHTLSLHQVSKRYGSKTVVDSVALEIGAGKFLTLLGPSGSGKTSILMMIAGFVAPSDGKIMLDGVDITSLPPEERNFGLVFQGYALFPHLTVERNIEFPLAVRGTPTRERAAKVAAAIEQVQLRTLAQRMPRELSGGQQQRVALARAMVFSPNILLLDEPLSALDKRLRADMQAELRHLHRQAGMTFVCVTHDQEEALSMSDEVAVLRDGRLIQVDTPRALYETPATHFVANFLGESNFIEGDMISRADDRIVFESGGIPIQQLSRPDSAPQGKLMVALRPSALRIGDRPIDLPNCIEGEITDLTYRGDRVVATARTRLGLLRVEELTTRLAGFAPQQRVWIGWTPDAGTIVVDDR